MTAMQKRKSIGINGISETSSELHKVKKQWCPLPLIEHDITEAMLRMKKTVNHKIT